MYSLTKNVLPEAATPLVDLAVGPHVSMEPCLSSATFVAPAMSRGSRRGPMDDFGGTNLGGRSYRHVRAYWPERSIAELAALPDTTGGAVDEHKAREQELREMLRARRPPPELHAFGRPGAPRMAGLRHAQEAAQAALERWARCQEARRQVLRSRIDGAPQRYVEVESRVRELRARESSRPGAEVLGPGRAGAERCASSAENVYRTASVIQHRFRSRQRVQAEQERLETLGVDAIPCYDCSSGSAALRCILRALGAACPARGFGSWEPPHARCTHRRI